MALEQPVKIEMLILRAAFLHLPLSVPLRILAFGRAVDGFNQDAAQPEAAFKIRVHNFKADFVGASAPEQYLRLNMAHAYRDIEIRF